MPLLSGKVSSSKRKSEEGEDTDSKLSKETKAFRKLLKEQGLNPDQAAIFVEWRIHTGTVERPARSEALKIVMQEVVAGRYGPETISEAVRRHATACFGDSTWQGYFDAFQDDPEGGIQRGAPAFQRQAAHRVLTEVFAWKWAREAMKGASSRRPVCLSSLYQVLTEGPTLARRLWSSTEGMFLGGDPSPAALLANAVRPTATGVPLTTMPDGAVQPRGGGIRGGRGGRGYIDPTTWAGMSADEQRAVRESRRGGGPGRGVGPGTPRRGLCHYCRLTRNISTNEHDERTCPFLAAERQKATPLVASAPSLAAPGTAGHT